MCLNSHRHVERLKDHGSSGYLLADKLAPVRTDVPSYVSHFN